MVRNTMTISLPNIGHIFTHCLRMISYSFLLFISPILSTLVPLFCSGIPLVYKFDTAMKPVPQNGSVYPLSGEFLEKKGLLRNALALEEELSTKIPGAMLLLLPVLLPLLQPLLQPLQVPLVRSYLYYLYCNLYYNHLTPTSLLTTSPTCRSSELSTFYSLLISPLLLLSSYFTLLFPFHSQDMICLMPI